MIALAHPRLDFAEVAVALPGERAGAPFHYRIPDGMAVAPGQLVVVPFGPRRLQGVVLRLDGASPVAETRPIEALVDPVPVVTPCQIELARWLADRYLVPFGRALELMVPTGLRASTDVALALRPAAVDDDRLRLRERRLVEYLRDAGPSRLRQLRSRLAMPDAGRVAARLERRGYLDRRPVLVGPHPRARPVRTATLTRAGAAALDDGALLTRAPRQAEALAFLRAQPDGRVAVEHLCAETGVDGTTVRVLAERGWVRVEESAPPLLPVQLARADAAPTLVASQSRAVDRLVEALDRRRSRAFLLHGVTASGKTEVYLRLIAAVLARGRGALVLVPEIALTPQTLHRFGARFPGRVVALHSRLTTRERFDAWQRVRDGRADVVVGSRSALFAPFRDLGAIVVDEEHEPSYKQESAPRYHGRETALALGRIAGAVVVLGSATPDVVTYDRAWRGEIELIEMPDRVAGPVVVGRPPPFPRVELVDLRRAAAEGVTPLLSPRLVELLGETLARGEQAILFLNRRGAATVVICAACGHVPRCRRCDVALVYHAAGDELICHHCNRRERPRETCPTCASTRLQYFGAGTQRVVLEVQRLFPTARVLRWDRDAMSRRHSAEELTRAFAGGAADVLVGTQAIAKGLDLPGVTLVGVVSADTALHLPDLRSAERTFQLLAQVAGRAGRGPRGGRVVLQTYSPDHPCVRAALKHDYASFARHELRFRKEHGYPPYGDLARAIFSCAGEASARSATARQAAVLRALVARLGLADARVVGPAPCYYRRVRGRYRWQLLVRGADAHQLLTAATWPPGWIVDVDPGSLL